MNNKTMIQYFEWYLPCDKSLWRKVKNEAKNLSDLGITSVWLPPAYKGAGGVTDVGYSVYDLFDLGEFSQKGTVETKYGSKDEYIEAIDELHKNNVEVLADIVLNHRTGADEIEKTYAVKDDNNDRTKTIEGLRKVEVWTKFDFWGRNGRYSNFKWNWTNFHGTDYDVLNRESGIFRFIGKEWDKDVDDELGNYDYLLGSDVDFSDEEVINELDYWGKWYVKTTKVDGFRLDAVKHISFSFYKNWLKKLREETKKELFSVGEYWSNDLKKLNNYLEAINNSASLFDVPLHFNFYNASISDSRYDLRELLKDTLVEDKPNLAVTFVDNHDSQYGQSLESWVREWFKPIAYGIILLREKGYPCVFYGDLYGIECQNIKKVSSIEKLIALRRDYAYGKENSYFDNEDVVGFTREGDEEHANSALATIFTNCDNEGEKEMYVGEKFKGSVFYDYLGNVNEKVVIDEKGYGLFKVNAKSISVYVKE